MTLRGRERGHPTSTALNTAQHRDHFTLIKVVSEGGGKQSGEKVRDRCPGERAKPVLEAPGLCEMGCVTPAAAMPAQGQQGMLSPVAKPTCIPGGHLARAARGWQGGV